MICLKQLVIVEMSTDSGMHHLGFPVSLSFQGRIEMIRLVCFEHSPGPVQLFKGWITLSAG